MLISLVLTSIVGLVLATLLLLLAGHRVRHGGPARSIPVVLVAALVAGEVAARVLRLPTAHVVVAEAVLLVSPRRRSGPGGHSGSAAGSVSGHRRGP